MSPRRSRTKAPPPEEPAGNPFAPAPYVEPEALSTEEQEAVVIAEVLDGAAPADAGQAAGLESRHAGAAVLRRPHVREALIDVLERAGVTDHVLSRVVRSGLYARRPVTHEGRITAQVPDHAARHKYLTTVVRLRGDLRDAGESENGDTWEAMVVAVRARRAARGAG